MFGRHPLPVDLDFGTQPRNLTDPKPYSEYTKDLEERLQAAFKTARRHTVDCRRRQKHFYDRRLRGSQVQRGDRVLILNVTP